MIWKGGVPLNKDVISARQLYVLLAAALLTPAVRALPTWTAATAGKGAWLTGIAAFPPLLAAGWILARLLKGRNGGLAGAFQEVLGETAGKGLTIIYVGWGLFLLCVEARLAGERIRSAGYRGGSLAVFLVILLGLTLWMGRRKLAAFARAAEIFYLVLMLALGLVLAFSILDVTPENVLPVWVEDVPGVLAATAVPVGVLSCGVFGAFLWGVVRPAGDSGRRGVRWLAWGCALLALLQFGVLAQLGPKLSAMLESPFFEVARGVGVQGAFQRVESVVVALWVLSDLALLGLLLFACRAMAGAVWGPKGETWMPYLAVGAALAGALVLFPDKWAAKELSATLIPLGNFLLALPVPGVVLLISRIRRGRR